MIHSTSSRDYSTLEVNDQQLPEFDPNPPIVHSYPEVVPYFPPHQSAKQPETSQGESTPEPTLCGLRKRTSWIIIVIGIIAIASIIGGTVGGILSSRKNQTTSSDTLNVTTINPNSGEPDPTAILPTTRIASTNFIDQYGNENYLVIYQLNSRAIYLSAWNSSHQEWVVSPLLDGTIRDSLDEIREGTYLSIDNYKHSDEQHDVHIYWQSSSDAVRSIMYSSNITTDKVIPPSAWIEKYKPEDFATAEPGSSIMSYAPQCDYCHPWTYYFCQVPSGRLNGAFRTPTANAGTPGWEFVDFVNGNIGLPLMNTSLAVVPAAATNESDQSINLFFQSASGVLTQIVYDGAESYEQDALDRGNLREQASIVAFSTGMNDTGLDFTKSLGFQVLTVDRDENPGIFSTYFRDGAWTAGENVEALADCSARGSMAANLAGRVYCAHDTSDGKVEIIEWAWGGDITSENTDYTDYRLIGTVGTKV